MRAPLYHVITPGDHYSPRTGSALPTVVDGLARAAEGDSRFEQFVFVQEGTMIPRYDSAAVIEYRAGRPGPSLQERAVDALVGRAGLPRPFARGSFLPVARRLFSCRPGIVVAHNGAALLRMPDLSRHRRVLYAHNDLFRSYSNAEAERTVAACDQVICVSEYLRATMADRVSSSFHDRFSVVLNGVDTTTFTPSVERPTGPLRVIFVGRVIPDKGVDVLVEAAASLDGADIEFLVVGSQGFERDARLTDYERRLRIRGGSRVRFEPFVDRLRLPNVLRERDVLVVPSRWPEPCGLTVAEGMASGLAVVASRVGGIPEVLGDAGVLVEPGNVSELAGVIDDLASSPERRERLATAGRLRAVANDWGRAWHRVGEVLAALL